MEKNYESFQLGFNQYFNLIATAVLNPNLYSTHLKKVSLNQSLIFFMINASLWLLLSTSIKTFLINKYHLFFAIFSESLFLVLAILLFLIFFAIVLQVLAKIFGSRTKLKNNLKAVLFSTILLPFFAVPVFKVLAAIISVYILIFSFKAINRFDRLKSVVPIVIPLGIFVFALYSMGIININLISR